MEQAFRQAVHEAKARGQSVFLSSHIRSEVEARIGILLAGSQWTSAPWPRCAISRP